MKFFCGTVLIAASLVMGSVHADPVPPSDASIHQLLEITHVGKLMNTMMEQMKGGMTQSALEATGHPLDAQEQQILVHHMDKVMDLMRTEMAWSEIEPEFTDIYRKNFSQKEIDDLLAFYQSPTGQAMITKMPIVMQEGMQVGMARAKQAMPQIQKINQEMLQEFKAYEASKAKQTDQH